MSDPSDQDVYFTKHLFRTGLECPTRLYYYAKNYPENREADPFIEHYHYNKQQLTLLARCSFPKGKLIDTSSIEQDYTETQKYLRKRKIVLFNPVFLHERLMAKVPILEKNGNDVNVYHIQIKAFSSDKHRISNHQGEVYTKWQDYILDFAFQLYVIGKCYPEWNLHPYLVLPQKYNNAKSNYLQQVLKQVKNGQIRPGKSAAHDEELLAYVEVSDEIKRIILGKSFDGKLFEGESFETVLKKLADIFYEGEKYPVTIGRKCKNCEFRIEQQRVRQGEPSGFKECWNDVLEDDPDKAPKSLVFNLIGPGTKDWIERGIYLQKNVPEGEFYEVSAIKGTHGKINQKQRQSLQVNQAKGRQVPYEFAKPKLFKELDRWKFPIHFLDFEAGNYVIPIRKNRRPYHLVVFQYSCHTLHDDGNWKHYEWLDERNGHYPNYEMVRSLKEVPHINEGTIVQYSNFERNALKTIRKELLEEESEIPDAEELSAWVSELVQRHDSSHSSGPFLSDLSRLVKNYYYNFQMEDSLSIKDVLQSVLAISPRLREIYSQPYSSSNFDSVIWWQKSSDGQVLSPYHLEHNEQQEGIKRGTEAMVVYARLLSENLSRQDAETCKKALLRYCELDTLAMFMIYQHWMYLLEENRN